MMMSTLDFEISTVQLRANYLDDIQEAMIRAVTLRYALVAYPWIVALWVRLHVQRLISQLIAAGTFQ